MPKRAQYRNEGKKIGEKKNNEERLPNVKRKMCKEKEKKEKEKGDENELHEHLFSTVFITNYIHITCS